ncbi:hypothetical protein O7627_36440 [Solwaraspora sp. WMMD1047]|uniref:hypothetical protein n=1 Tax=Solwaraspora sp. WMMD1047 TaxID=3016102 RepID=UPI002417D27F|nr:hypothetical protein [Solwaraspora sp. WMMD1047]MDG4834758.1 hypothetical protein [Solwaraspora sp. WMMD1047]
MTTRRSTPDDAPTTQPNDAPTTHPDAPTTQPDAPTTSTGPAGDRPNADASTSAEPDATAVDMPAVDSPSASAATATAVDNPPATAADKPAPATAGESAQPVTVVDDPALPVAASPVDPWTSFGPAPEHIPTRFEVVRSWIGRRLTHEWSLATIASLLLAVVMTWPTLRYPLHTIPQDIWDPTLQSWQMAWSGHILLTNPAQLWHSNTFYPESWSFAFSDTLLGYAPFGMIGSGPTAAVLRYNIVFVLAHALASLGAYALVRQLGAGRIGAAVAAVSYAYAPWLLAQAGHLHIISNGGIPLALAMLARGHGWSMRPGAHPRPARPAWVFGGWLVAAWQVSLGFGIGLVFGYVLALIVVVSVLTWLVRRALRRPRRPFGWPLLTADIWGGLVFAATGILLALPYFKVADLHPNATRDLNIIQAYSPPPTGFVTAPAESLLWGGLHAGVRDGLPWHPEMTLLPGFVLYGLALAGLFFSIWSVRQRLLLLAGVLVSGILAMGTRFFGGTYTYAPLFEHLPGWDGLRTPGRLMIWTTLLLGILAAGSVSAFARRAREISAAERVPPRPGPWLRLATLLPLALVLAEGLNTTPHPIVPSQPAAMRTEPGPILVLPSDQNTDQNAMLWSTTRFQDLVNGGSGFTPASLAEIREVAATFPDPASVQFLRERGVRTVVLLRDRVDGTPWQTVVDLPVDELGIEREDVGETVVFRL